MNSIEKKVVVKDISNIFSNFVISRSKKAKNKLAVFDFDETLVKSKHVFNKINKVVLDFYGLPYDDNIVSNFFMLYDKKYLGWGRNLKEQKKIYTENVQPLVTKLFNEPKYFKQMEFFTGMKNVILELAKTDIALAIASSRDLNSIMQFLKYEGVEGCFDIIEATDGGLQFKDKPDTQIVEYISQELGIKLSNAVMIGDSLGDMVMAKNAGMKSIGAAFSKYVSIFHLQCNNPDVIISEKSDITKLPSIISDLLSEKVR